MYILTNRDRNIVYQVKVLWKCNEYRMKCDVYKYRWYVIHMWVTKWIYGYYVNIKRKKSETSY